MTKDEAIKLLSANHICPKHGTKMILRSYVFPYHTERWWKCESCELGLGSGSVEEAKKVLGIGG